MIKDKISILRDRINKLDDKILDLFDERSQIVNEIGSLKDKSKSVVDAQREESILERLLKNLKGYYSKDSIVRIWRELFYASTRLQINPELDIVPKRGIENIKVYTGGKSTVKGKSKIINE